MSADIKKPRPQTQPRPRRHWQRRVDVRDEAVRRAERVRGVCRGGGGGS